MKRIYIAGPISKGNVEQNVWDAIEVGLSLLDLGFAVFIPHFSFFAEPDAMCGTERYEQWLANDLKWVEVSDAVYRLPGDSVGADREVMHALRKGIPVFCEVSEIIEHFSKE